MVEVVQRGAEASGQDKALDQLARLIARTLGATVAFIALAEDDATRCIAGFGLPADWAANPFQESCKPLLSINTPVFAANKDAYPQLWACLKLRELGLASCAIAPLLVDEERLPGVLVVGAVEPRSWSVDDMATLQGFAASVAELIATRQALVAAKRRITNLEQRQSMLLQAPAETAPRLSSQSVDIAFHFAIKPQRRYTRISANVATVLGYGAADFYADPDLLGKITVSEDHPAILEEHSDYRYTSDALLRLHHKNGSIVWLDIHRNPIYENGELVAYEGVARDVSQFMRTAAALRYSEQNYRELFAAAQRQTQELALLDQVRTALTREISLPAIFKTVVEASARTFGYLQTSIYLIDGPNLVLQHQVGYDHSIPVQPMSQGVIGRVARTGKPVLLEDVKTEPDFLAAMEGIVSEVCVPLFDQERIVGILNVETTTGALNEADLQLMTSLSEQVSIAINRARLYNALRDNEAKYRSVVENVTEVIYQTDNFGLWTYLNPAWTMITGFGMRQSIGTGIVHYIHVEDRLQHEAEFSALIEGRQDYSRYEIRCQTKGAGTRWLEVHAQPIVDDGGTIIGTSGTLNDITDRKLAEEALLRQNEELAALHETTLGLINQLDLTSLLQAVLNRASALIGAPHGFLYLREPEDPNMVLRVGVGIFETIIATNLEPGVGISGDIWVTGESSAVDDYIDWPNRNPLVAELGVRAIAGTPLRSGVDVVGVLGLAYTDENVTFNLEEVALLSRFGQLASLALENARLYDAAQQELKERKRAEARLAFIALHDSLTGLPNRVLLHDRLHQAILNSFREHTSLALLIMDVDRFKEVNDTLGHHFGDELLQQIGARLQAALRSSDTVARLGGDEFAVVLPGADLEGATLAVRKILAVMDVPFALENHILDVRISVGIALMPDHGDNGEVLLRRADVAMYIAKRAGGGFAVYSSEQDPYSPTRLALAGELRRAIELDELVLFYQPKVNCQTGHVTGCEALVRWRHPMHGLLGPDKFLPLAEHTGLINMLSQWVLSTALAQCRLWREHGLLVPIAVNLSMRDLHDERLPYTVQKLLETWEVDPALLSVEITEDAVMSDLGDTIEVLSRLRSLGVRLAIDDFGTGQSSLAQLKRLPVVQLKIDKSFVREMALNENDAVIVRSTIDLGHNLGLLVVAEGVEDLSTLKLLAELGCDEAQGYYLSKPIPAADFAEWIARREETHVAGVSSGATDASPNEP